MRRDKLVAIGTMLEKATVIDSHIAPNSRMPIPQVFVNRKIYGKATKDDPANNIELAKV